MYRDKNKDKNRNIKKENKSFEKVEKLTNMGKPQTNQNSIQEESESTMKSGNGCYHLLQKNFSSGFMSKNIKISLLKPPVT